MEKIWAKMIKEKSKLITESMRSVLPSSSHDVERLSWPVKRVALPLGEVDLVDAAAYDDAHVAVIFRKVVGRSVRGNSDSMLL